MRRFAHYHEVYDWRYAEAETKNAALLSLRKQFRKDGGADADYADGELREIGQSEHQYGPRPTCCEAVNGPLRLREYDGPAIILKTHQFSHDKGGMVPHVRWEIREASLKISHCPHCGTKLPDVELKENPPKPIYESDGDDGHCLTCDSDSHGWCQCNPASAGYKFKT